MNNSWSSAAEEMYPTGVGSGDTTLLVAAHNAGDTSQSTLRNFSVASAVSSLALGLSLPMAWRNPVQKEEQQEFRKAEEVPSVLSAGVDLVESNHHNIYTTQRLPATEEQPSNATAGEDLVQCSKPNSGVPNKEAERIEFENFPKSTIFVIWKMNFNSEVCSSSILQQKRWCGSMKSTPPRIWTNGRRVIRCWDEQFQTSRSLIQLLRVLSRSC